MLIDMIVLVFVILIVDFVYLNWLEPITKLICPQTIYLFKIKTGRRY